jgi:hypothetical protein
MMNRSGVNVAGIVRQVWVAVRPSSRQQWFLWWTGILLQVSGVIHAVVFLMDGSSWWGPVSWRKPVVFALSFGILLWSVVWVLRQLPIRRWSWIPVGTLGGLSVVEVGLITMQRWRGQASHFNQGTAFDSAVWAVMGMSVIFIALAVGVLMVWSLVQFRGSPAARIAVPMGLLGVLAAGYIGKDMAAIGEAAVAATGQVPQHVMFGAAGSAKLAHAVGLHSLQVIGLLAIGLEIAHARPFLARALVVLGSAGYAALFLAVTVTAYAGRSWTHPAAPVALLGLAGGLALLGAGSATLLMVLRVPDRFAQKPVHDLSAAQIGMVG